MKMTAQEGLKAILEKAHQRAASFFEKQNIDGGLETCSKDRLEELYERFVMAGDLGGAAAALIGQKLKFGLDDETQLTAKKLADMLGSQGAAEFYDWSNCEKALLYLELAAGLDPDNFEASFEVISVCTQGHPFRPEEALPYAVNAARLDPARDEVAYVTACIEQNKTTQER